MPSRMDKVGIFSLQYLTLLKRCVQGPDFDASTYPVDSLPISFHDRSHSVAAAQFNWSFSSAMVSLKLPPASWEVSRAVLYIKGAQRIGAIGFGALVAALKLIPVNEDSIKHLHGPELGKTCEWKLTVTTAVSKIFRVGENEPSEEYRLVREEAAQPTTQLAVFFNILFRGPSHDV